MFSTSVCVTWTSPGQRQQLPQRTHWYRGEGEDSWSAEDILQNEVPMAGLEPARELPPSGF